MTGLYSTIGMHIALELERAHSLHGSSCMANPDLGLDFRLGVLGEEFGEVCKELIEKNSPAHLRAELVQLAAMSIAWIEVLDMATGEHVEHAPACAMGIEFAELGNVRGAPCTC